MASALEDCAAFSSKGAERESEKIEKGTERNSTHGGGRDKRTPSERALSNLTLSSTTTGETSDNVDDNISVVLRMRFSRELQANCSDGELSLIGYVIYNGTSFHLSFNATIHWYWTGWDTRCSGTIKLSEKTPGELTWNRVRPLNNQEFLRRDSSIVSFPGSGSVSIDNNGIQKPFSFNVIFEPEATQEDVFEHSGTKKLVDMAVNGFTCLSLAFGQTGSGKTHTMTGPPQQNKKDHDPTTFGIVQRSFVYLFSALELHNDAKYVIKASYLEIYNEQVIDLLNPHQRRHLAVRWSKRKGFYVENLFQVECEAVEGIMAVLEEGTKNRHVGSHGMNETSSRSHSILSISISSETQDPEDSNLYITKKGKLTFVDLAGSEKVRDTAMEEEKLIESNSINKSLLVLGKCISCLGDPKKRQGHIPYRDSKLTKLLAESLSGSGVTLLIACVTPSSYNVTESMNTLRYANRAKRIKSKPVVTLDPREKLIVALKRDVKILRNENQYLRQQLEFPDKPRNELLKKVDKKFLDFMKEHGKAINNGLGEGSKSDGLYEMLQEYMVENEALRAENSDLHFARDRQWRDHQELWKENERLTQRVEDLEKLVAASPATWQLPANSTHQIFSISPRQSPLLPIQTASGGSQGAEYTDQMPLRAYPVHHLPGVKMRPPHRLSEPVSRSSYRHQIPPISIASPGISPHSSFRSSDSRSMGNSTESVHVLNQRLRQEVAQLDGEIQHEELNRKAKTTQQTNK